MSNPSKPAFDHAFERGMRNRRAALGDAWVDKSVAKANAFNAELRSKKLRESRLDEMPGLGPKRKAALLARFGSIQKLRQASVEELAEVDGVSDKLAAEIAKFLEGR